MDVVSAAAVLPLLVRYAEHLGGLAARAVDDTIVERLRAVWDAVRGRLSRDPQAAGAMDRLADQPGNARRQAAVEDHLEEVLEADDDFAAVLAGLVRVAERSTGEVRVSDAGAVAIGGDVTIRGGRYAAGRDISVGDRRGDRNTGSA